LEKAQILQLMNVIAERIFVGFFELEIGTAKLENKVQKAKTFRTPICERIGVVMPQGVNLMQMIQRTGFATT
jgi:hypothetical protein